MNTTNEISQPTTQTPESKVACEDCYSCEGTGRIRGFGCSGLLCPCVAHCEWCDSYIPSTVDGERVRTCDACAPDPEDRLVQHWSNTVIKSTAFQITVSDTSVDVTVERTHITYGGFDHYVVAMGTGGFLLYACDAVSYRGSFDFKELRLGDVPSQVHSAVLAALKAAFAAEYAGVEVSR